MPMASLLVAEDGVAAVGPVFFGFGGVEPEGVPALGEEWAGEAIPVGVAGFGVGGVVDAGVGDEEVFRFEFFVGVGGGVDESPGGDQGVDVLVVEFFQVGGDVVVVVVEDGIAFVLPPEPVLHHDVEGDVFGAVAVGDGEDLVERGVAVFRLDEAVGPAGQHRSVAGEVRGTGG